MPFDDAGIERKYDDEALERSKIERNQQHRKQPLNNEQIDEAIRLLNGGAMFKYCTRDQLQLLARKMESCHLQKGDVLVQQGERSTEMFVLAKGEAIRLRYKDGVEHHVDTKKCGTTINSLHLPMEDRCYATAKCKSDECVAYSLSSQELKQTLRENPELAMSVVVSLSKEVRQQTKHMRTPFLEQHAKDFNVPSTALAAGMESYYRSALNTMINARLTGVKGALFPNMHIQVPTRIVYITGLKGIRGWMDRNLHPDEWSNPTLVRWFEVFAPGVIMTPVSSVLEASNAGHANPEPLYKRWSRGVFFRLQREVVFAAGLNQLSDYFEERAHDMFTKQDFKSDVLANALGSLMAGVTAGYLSHVPHNMSTLKLLSPNKSYGELFKEFVRKSAQPMLVPNFVPNGARPFIDTMIACLFPRGCIVRTSQIIGSFILLNGAISLLAKSETKRALANWRKNLPHIN